MIILRRLKIEMRNMVHIHNKLACALIISVDTTDTVNKKYRYLLTYFYC